MNLTGRQIVEHKIVTGPIAPENIQQHGVDLNLVQVSRIHGPGYIPTEGKTVLAERVRVLPTDVLVPDGSKRVKGWRLKPGAYDIVFAQGCNIPSNQRAEIVHRSSLFRNGGTLRSALFDAGFNTEGIGTVMIITEEIVIGFNARIGQMIVTLSNYVNPEDLYNGQWQNDKQREANGGKIAPFKNESYQHYAARS